MRSKSFLRLGASGSVAHFRCERLERRTLLSTVIGDAGVADVFKPDPSSLLSDSRNNQVLIDVTNLPASWGTPSATPNDSSNNDADAFNAVLSFIETKILAYRTQNPGMGGYNSPDTDFAIYVPAGQYDIKSPIRFDPNTTTVEMAHIRILGQSRDGNGLVTINAIGNASAYTGGFAMDLFTYDHASGQTINNRPARNVFSNFNLQLSSSLVAAGISGMQVVGANTFRMKNVRITGASSSSSTEFGLVVREPTAGLISNVTVDGFGIGVGLEGYQLISTDLANMTVTHQGVAGIEADGGQPTIENLLSNQTRSSTSVPFPTAIVADDAAAVTVIGGSLTTTGSTGGATSNAMFTHAGHDSYSPSSLTAINVAVGSGYGTALSYNGTAQNNLQTSTSSTPFSGVASQGTAMSAPISSAITGALSDFNDYLRVDSPGGNDFGSGTVPHAINDPDLTWITITQDDLTQDYINNTLEVQIAGTPGPVGLNFTSRSTTFEYALDVPANVNVIDFGYGFVYNHIGDGTTTQPLLLVAHGNATTDPLVISNITLLGKTTAHTLSQGFVALQTNRPIGFDSVSVDSKIIAIQDTHSGGVSTIYLQDTGGFMDSDLADAATTSTRVYARGVNSEGDARVAFGNWGNNARVYIAGFKTEGDNINFEVNDNARLYVFGGASSQQGVVSGSQNPILEYNGNTSSQVFLSVSTYRQPDGDTAPRRFVVVQTPHSGNVLTVPHAGIPQRSRPGQTTYDYFVPFLSIISGTMRWKDSTQGL